MKQLRFGKEIEVKIQGITLHARKRMKERRITWRMIKETAHNPYLVIFKGKTIVFKGLKIIVIVGSNGIVVTVFWSREKQRKKH